LGDVIKALSEKSNFVPFRNSTLTWLLKDSIGGNSKTTMIATVTPNEDGYQESVSTLKYVERAKLIAQKAVINDMQSDQSLILMLKDQIKTLQKEYDDYRSSSLILRNNDEELIKCKEEIENLKEEINRLNEIINTYHDGNISDANILLLNKERDRLRDAFNSKMLELDKLDELLEKEKSVNEELSLKIIQQTNELISLKSDNESINNELNYTYDELDKCKEQYEQMIQGLEDNFAKLITENEEQHKSALEEIEIRRAMQYVELNRKLEKIEQERQQEKYNLTSQIDKLKKKGNKEKNDDNNNKNDDKYDDDDDDNDDNDDDDDVNNQIINVLSLVHIGLQKIEGQCLDMSTRTSDSSPRKDNDIPNIDDDEFFEKPKVPSFNNNKISRSVSGILSKQKSIFELIHNLFKRVFLRSNDDNSLSPSSQHSNSSYDVNTLSQSLVDSKLKLAEVHSDNLELQLKYSNLEKYCW
jgi:hypothetical protein